jgi:hypothetical protein
MAETMSRGTYARERVNLTADTIRKARSMIASGRFEGRGVEFLDTSCKGLTLRVTRSSGTWYLRMRSSTIRLGTMDTMPVPAAREAATRARLDVNAGADPRADVAMFERVVSRGDDLAHAVAVAFPEYVKEQSDADRRCRGPWQWRDLIDEFLAMKIPTLKEGYGHKYRAYLEGDEFDEILRMPLDRIDYTDLEALRDRVVASRTVSAAARTISQGKEAMTWAWTYHKSRSGLGAERHPWWQGQWAIQYKASTRDHTPTTVELVRTLIVAERHLALGSTRQETGPGMLAALWAIVLTAQRSGALVKTERTRVIEMRGRPGWEVWTWSGKMMKGGGGQPRPHAIPIPPAAIEAIARCGVPRDSEGLFPSRAAGKSITSTGINQFFYRLQGKGKPGKNGAVTVRPEGDLLKAAGIEHWRPHDARRSMTTFLDDEELGGSGSAILAHKPRKNEPEHALVEDITRRVYDKAQRLELKARGMEAWVAHVVTTYERERAQQDVWG